MLLVCFRECSSLPYTPSHTHTNTPIPITYKGTNLYFGQLGMWTVPNIHSKYYTTISTFSIQHCIVIFYKLEIQEFGNVGLNLSLDTLGMMRCFLGTLFTSMYQLISSLCQFMCGFWKEVNDYRTLKVGSVHVQVLGVDRGPERHITTDQG